MSDVTEVIGILDASGSMSNLTESTISGFNEFLEQQQRNQEGQANITLTVFDDKPLRLYHSDPIEQARRLNRDVYNPGGRTALLDAIGMTIEELGKLYHWRARDLQPDNVICFVTTDGNENASQYYQRREIANMVEEQREKWGWEFIFTGANIDEFAAGREMNFSANMIGGFEHNDRGMKNNFQAIGNATTQMRELGEVQDDWNDNLDDHDKRDWTETDDDDLVFGQQPAIEIDQ